MITLLCGSKSHPIVRHLRKWINLQTSQNRKIDIHFTHEDVTPSGVLFALSYGRILPEDFVKQFDHVIVLHASDLPKGRGWSPYIWEILEGADFITLSAISAAKGVDEGDIWEKEYISISPTDIYLDINKKLFNAEVRLIERVLEMIENGEAPTPQLEDAATYYPRRNPEDSRVHLESKLGDIFNLLRTADPKRYPVFFEKDGVRFNLLLEKVYEDT
jgi:methionyl-tRNA formyltransferase